MNKAQKIFWAIVGYIIIAIIIGFVNPLFAVGLVIVPIFLICGGLLIYLCVLLYMLLGDDDE